MSLRGRGELWSYEGDIFINTEAQWRFDNLECDRYLNRHSYMQ